MSNLKKRYYLVLNICEIVDIKLILLASIRSMPYLEWLLSEQSWCSLFQVCNALIHMTFIMPYLVLSCWIYPISIMFQYQTLVLAFVVSTCFKVTSWLVNAFPHSHIHAYALTVEELKEMCNYVLSLGLSIKNKLTQDVLFIYLKNKDVWKVWLCLFVVSLPCVSLFSLVCSHELLGRWNFL
jgi:hypothetical protein